MNTVKSSAQVINLGSINIDHVYRVPHFVQPGETLASEQFCRGLGGKGANQSVAIARAGGAVAHVGQLSESDSWAVESLAQSGVNIDAINLVDTPSGHAIIQIDEQGENCIILHGGANQSLASQQLRDAIAQNTQAKYLLLQNECNLLGDVFELAKQNQLKIVLNPAPMTDRVKSIPLEQLDTLIVNELEARALSGENQLDSIVTVLQKRLPDTRIVITLGGKGAVLINDGELTREPARTVEVIDTTAAGDTFVGYFLAGLVNGVSEHEALKLAINASAITVGQLGAVDSIPYRKQLS